MSDYVYPRKATVVAAVTSILSDDEIRDQLIQLRESGVSAKVALLRVISQATGDGARPPEKCRVIAGQIEVDIAALKQVDALDYAKAPDFKAALDSAATVVPTAMWITKLQAKHDIDTGTSEEQFTALKAKLQAELDAQTV